MSQRVFYRLVMATAAASYLLIVCGGAIRLFQLTGSVPVTGYRLLSLGVFCLAAITGAAGGSPLWLRRPALALGWAVPAVLALIGSLAGPLEAGAPFAYPEAVSAFAATWLATAVYRGEEPFHSRLSMLRSQWQVPLYAAAATFSVVVLGERLKALGLADSCSTWPLCADWAGLNAIHIAHRGVALLAGGLLLYTAQYVWRHHQRRPFLLSLSGTSLVLYTTQVLLGAQAARGELHPSGALLHLVLAAVLIGTLIMLATAGYYAPSLPAIAGAEEAVPAAPTRPIAQVARDYLMLMKPRILILLLITGFAAMWVASGGPPSLALSVATLVGLGASCGAANAINMWWDRDIDAIMSRTQTRPIPAGRLTPEQAFSFGVLMMVLAYVLLASAVNLLAALLALAGFLYYVFIYTIWLKRSTPMNIVIGGAAGAVPPLVGWAAVTGTLDWAAVWMFVIIFIWTPPHFWALALFRSEDYRKAGVPMLPVLRGEEQTKSQILNYSALLLPVTMALYWTGTVGVAYVITSVIAGLLYLCVNVALLRERLPGQKWAVRSFAASVIWLGIIFLAMVLDTRGLP